MICPLSVNERIIVMAARNWNLPLEPTRFKASSAETGSSESRGVLLSAIYN